MTHSFPPGASGSQCPPLDYFTAESLNLNTDATFDHNLTPAADHLHHTPDTDADLEWSAFTTCVLNTDLLPLDDFVASSFPHPVHLKQEPDDVSDTKQAIVQSNPLLDKMLALPLNAFKSEPDANHSAPLTNGTAKDDSDDWENESDESESSESEDTDSDETSDSDDEEEMDKVESHCEETAVKKEEKDEPVESVPCTSVKKDPDEGETKENDACERSAIGNGTGSMTANVKTESMKDVKEAKAKVNGVVKKEKKVKVKKENGSNDKKEKKNKEKSPRGKKRKSNLQRRNIKKVMSEDKLSEEVLAARREEEERIERQKQALLDFKKSSQFAPPVACVKSERMIFQKEIDEICLSSDDDDPVSARREMIELLSDEEDKHNVTGSGDGTDADDFDANNCGLYTDDRYNQPDSAGRVLVNVGHRPDEADVFLSPQLSRAVKPHQIGGIRFLYANVVESASSFSGKPGVGCILAHAMGLGKTLQVIAFIDILFSSTTAKHVLCVVPINTLQNWIAEFDMWIPSQPTIEQSFKAEKEEVRYRRFNLYVLNADLKTLLHRSKELLTWKNNGGVLLMGYEMYRMLVVDLAKSRKTDLMTEEEYDSLQRSIQRALVDPGPDVVICDEGHRIKNAKSGISHALKTIRTKRRIVLTGYPLQNNLMEYWCMVDFVRPNFLGSEKEFSNMFEKPIKNGTFSDSTDRDKRIMRLRSHALYKILAGFVQRRSHIILKNSLPVKFEHVFLTRLTPIQKSLLMALFSYLRQERETDIRVSPIILFSICNKIWNHPDILYHIVNENGSLELDDDVDLIPTSASGKKKKKTAKKGVKTEVAAPFDLLMQSPSTSSQYFPSYNPFPATPPQSMSHSGAKERTLDYSWAEPCFRGYVPNVLSNSTKMVLLFDLMDKIISMNDRMLIFSQSLLTLNIIEKFMSDRHVPGTAENWNRGFNYFRLDGSTAALDRERYINSFNRDTTYKVFLLSTKAGCLGINLIGASRIVLFDASWNPCHDAQAACRIYRYGQLKSCYIYRLVADNSLEKKIYDRQVNKQGMSHRVVDELNPETKFTTSEICSLIEGLENFQEPSLEPFTDADIVALTDPLVVDVSITHRQLLTKVPFEHESLLLDDKESRLSKAEKMMAMSEYMAAKSGNVSGRCISAPYYPTTNGSSSTAGHVTGYPWQQSPQPGSSQAHHQFIAAPYRQQPIRPEYLNYPPAGTHTVANGQAQYLIFNETKAKLMNRGFTDINRLTLSKEIVLNDKVTGRPSSIRAGEQVFVMHNPETGDRILLTNDCKIVSIPPNAPNHVPRAPVAAASSGPPVVVTLSDDEE